MLKKLNLTSTVDAAQSLNLYEVSKKMNNSKKKFNFKCQKLNKKNIGKLKKKLNSKKHIVVKKVFFQPFIKCCKTFIVHAKTNCKSKCCVKA